MKNTLLYLFAILLLSCFTIFKDLGTPPIRMWDEATYANNSIDMVEHGLSFTVTQLGKVDWYNTKPPLVIWLQALSMKAFGINELSVRIPSAVFGLLTIVLVFLFCNKVLQSPITGFISALVLLTSKGFICDHVVLTGDLDAVLVFWLTLGLLSFIHLLVNDPEDKILVYLVISASLVFGFLSKGVAGYFLVPGMIILFFINGNFRMMRDKRLYTFIFFAIALCFSYYLIREISNPGYLLTVWRTEIMRYEMDVMSWHVHPFDFYLRNLINDKFQPFIYILLLTIPVAFLLFSQKKKFKALIFLIVSAAIYLLIISYPGTKLEWYDAPLYPILATITGITAVETLKFITEKILRIKKQVFGEILITIVLSLALIYPVKEILNRNHYNENEIYYMEFEGAYLKHLLKNYINITDLTIYKIEKNEELYDQVLFYKRALKHNRDFDINIKTNPEFENGELVMISKDEDRETISKNYNFELVDEWNGGMVCRISGKKF